jgi:uncharacterized protein YndB with AHSA1/START domain
VSAAGARDTIVREITIKAPAARIFDALTNPEELVTWWGAPGKFHATHAECDLRPGGRWMMRVTNWTGTPATVSGAYRVIERPRVLVLTWLREAEPEPETVVRWDLDEHEGVTTVRMTHSGFTSDRARARNSGWPLILELLRAHVEPKPAAGA